MTDKAVLVVLLYMMFSFGFGILVGKSIKAGQGEDHELPR
jgi:hypothetical protein